MFGKPELPEAREKTEESTLAKIKKDPEKAAEEAPQTVQEPAKEKAPDTPKETGPSELDKALAAQAKEHDQYLRLAAEFDNFRKRSAKEKDNIYQDARAETVKKFLPVYDNLERAMKNETADEAYKKGVEMTMRELVKILEAMDVKPFGIAGDIFDPQRYNAVMHVEDEALAENVVAEVFQTGFLMGERVIRFAMVKVAN